MMTLSRAYGTMLVALSLGCGVRPALAQAMPVRVALSDAMPPISFMEQGQANGLFKEVLAALFALTPGYRPEFRAYPWARAQWLLQNRQMDLFLTFPSQERRNYATFTRQPVFTLDYGTLVYRKGSVNAEKILAAKSFEDLRGLVFISQEMVAWEQENVPAFIARYSVHNPSAIMHMAYQRKTGDFFIMPVEQAIYYSNQLGYQNQLAYRKVGFIPNSQVPFHIGVRKSFEGGSQLLAALEAAMRQPAFRIRLRSIEQKYRQLAIAESPVRQSLR